MRYPHGHPWAYCADRCRCDLCREGWRSYIADYRRRRKERATAAA